MHLIKKCPSCSRKLRFPIDRGKIRVSCTCGASFVADPDDTSLYDGAAFDLEQGKARKAGGGLSGFTAGFARRANAFMERAIKAAYNTRYRLQNFMILPSGEQRKIVIALVLVLAALFVLGYLLCAPGHGTVADGVI